MYSHDPSIEHLDWASVSTHAASYIRITAISIAAYEYVGILCAREDHNSGFIGSYFMTLPAEWRFYKNQKSWRLSPGCILFILIR